MKGPVVKKRMKPDARRQQLLDIAVDVFAEKGIGEARHVDIARIAGVSVATTFVYFPTRDALVQGVLGHVDTVLTGLLDWARDSDLPLEGILPALAERVLDMTESHTNLVRLWMSWGTHFGPEIRASYLKFLDKDLTRVSELLQRGGVPQQEAGRDDARILIAVTQALVQMKLDGEAPDKLARFSRHAIDMVLAYRAEQFD